MELSTPCVKFYWYIGFEPWQFTSNRWTYLFIYSQNLFIYLFSLKKYWVKFNAKKTCEMYLMRQENFLGKFWWISKKKFHFLTKSTKKKKYFINGFLVKLIFVSPRDKSLNLRVLSENPKLYFIKKRNCTISS